MRGAPTLLDLSPSSPWLPRSSTGKCCEQAEQRLLCQPHKRVGLSSVLQRALLNHTPVNTTLHTHTLLHYDDRARTHKDKEIEKREVSARAARAGRL